MFVTVQYQVESVSPEYLQQVAAINDGVIASFRLDQIRDQDRVMVHKRDAEQSIVRRKRPQLIVEIVYAIGRYSPSVLVRLGLLHKPGRIDCCDDRAVRGNVLIMDPSKGVIELSHHISVQAVPGEASPG